MDKIKNVAQRLGIITVEDMERYTALELIMMIANKMNDCSDELQDLSDKVHYLLNEGTLEEVIQIFDEWLQDGTFDTLINQTALKEVNERIDETSAQLSPLLYTKHFLSDYGISSDKYEKIRDVFSDVTLEQVKKMNSLATLESSAHWYTIQKLINDLPNFSKIIVDGHYYVDLPLKINRAFLTISGLTDERMNYSITQKSANCSLFIAKGSYISFENLLLSGEYQGESKTLHGIEIVGDKSYDFNQSDHFKITNCYIQNFGGCGLFCENTHFVLNSFKDTIFYNCYDNGIFLKHSADSQMNAMTFDNVSTYNNGLEYVDGGYSRIKNPTTDRGHGMSISGTGILITGGDSSSNSSCGLYIHEGYYTEGLVCTGRYFEDNSLANIYSDGNKALSLIGNYMYPALSKLGNIYYKYPAQNINEIQSELLTTVWHTNKPIWSTTYNGNKEYHPTAIADNSFVLNGHGLLSGTRIFPVINADAGIVYSANIYPDGICNKGETGYYVVQPTDNTFKLSLTKDGGPITIVGSVDTYDLNKFHFETNEGSVIYATNLPVSKPKKIKAIVEGRILTNGAPNYIIPVASGSFVDDKWVVNGKENTSYPQNFINGDIYIKFDINADLSSYVNIAVKGYGISTPDTSDIQKFVTQEISNNHTRLTQSDGMDGILFQQCNFANGTTIELYLD